MYKPGPRRLWRQQAQSTCCRSLSGWATNGGGVDFSKASRARVAASQMLLLAGNGTEADGATRDGRLAQVRTANGVCRSPNLLAYAQFCLRP
eukprot:6188102-Pleurochrysis_carterae.AAC.1